MKIERDRVRERERGMGTHTLENSSSSWWREFNDVEFKY
jgi:hypothetical protein